MSGWLLISFSNASNPDVTRTDRVSFFVFQCALRIIILLFGDVLELVHQLVVVNDLVFQSSFAAFHLA